MRSRTMRDMFAMVLGKGIDVALLYRWKYFERDAGRAIRGRTLTHILGQVVHDMAQRARMGWRGSRWRSSWR